MATASSRATASTATSMATSPETNRAATAATAVPRAVESPAAGAAAAPRARRTRRGWKRTTFQVPRKMPAPVRALWLGASEEQRARAHTTAATILKTWLGRATREEAAKELGLSSIRLWQLSQQAVCGLVVGCLRQPRFRGPARSPLPGEEGLGVLRQKISRLERELDGAQRLISLLKDLPGQREVASVPEGAQDARRRRRGAGKVSSEVDARAAGGPGTTTREGEPA